MTDHDRPVDPLIRDMAAALAQEVARYWQGQFRPDIPAHIQSGRAAGDGVPQGMHVCRSGRADGCAWIIVDDWWYCPFCGEHGPAFDEPN